MATCPKYEGGSGEAKAKPKKRVHLSSKRGRADAHDPEFMYPFLVHSPWYACKFPVLPKQLSADLVKPHKQGFDLFDLRISQWMVHSLSSHGVLFLDGGSTLRTWTPACRSDEGIA